MKFVQKQTKKTPKSVVGSQNFSIEGTVHHFNTYIQSFLETLTPIESSINDIEDALPKYIESQILRKPQHRSMMTRWIAESGCRAPKLLYRGTRDGCDAYQFHKHCDDWAPTLTIIRSNHGKIFGGFSDQPWTGQDGGKSSNKAWIFSIDEGAKFPVRQKFQSCAIFTKQDYGPTFGDAFDIYLPFDFKSESCYSDFGRGYDSGKDNKEENRKRLAGSYYFSVDEIEVFGLELVRIDMKNSMSNVF